MKIAIIVKIESARRMMGRGKRRKPFFSLPPSHRSPALSFSFSPVSLQRKEASTEKRGWSLVSLVVFFAGAEELLVSLRGYVTPGRSFPAVCAPDEDIALKVKFVLKSL